MPLNRLITSGCSYTQYCWPTWADYLATAFDHHLQLGKSGMDCARIARGVLDTEITQSDVVVICWTGFDRFNYQYEYKWQGLGSMLGNKDFYTKYYTAQERFATMYDAMTLIDLDSKTRGYQTWHFSAFPWLLGEIEKTPHPENIARSQSRDLNNLFMHEDLESYKLGINDPRTSHKYNPHDDHPTPECHWKWLKQVILPQIKIDLDLDDRVKLDQQRVLRGDVN
jgi:hypothetical protein